MAEKWRLVDIEENDSKWVSAEELVQMKAEIVDTVWERYLQFETKLGRCL